MTKDEARKQMRRQRKEWTGRDRKIATMQARARLFTYLGIRRVTWLYPFVSCGTEIDTMEVIEGVLVHFPWMRIAVPKVNGSTMDFYEIHGMQDLQKGYQGILEPITEERVEANNGIMLLPGLAFDRQGGRVGYGAGFYDRYIAAHAALEQKNHHLHKIGYGFSFQLLDSIETQEYDIVLDGIMTDREFLLFQK